MDRLTKRMVEMPKGSAKDWGPRVVATLYDQSSEVGGNAGDAKRNEGMPAQQGIRSSVLRKMVVQFGLAGHAFDRCGA